MEKITKDMKFSKVMKEHPQIVPIFLKHGLSCVGCPLAAQETIEEGAKSHGVDVPELIKDLNEHLRKNE